MKRTKLLNKIAVAVTSLLACVTCFGVATNVNDVNVVADGTNVALDYTLTKGSRNSAATGYVGNVWAEEVSFTNANNQVLKGIELKSDEKYTHTTSGATYDTVGGYYMHYQQHLTLKIEDTVDMSEPIEFLFNPYVSTKHESHRFVMGLTDTDGTVESANASKTNGFNAPTGANYIYWDLGRSTKWNVSDQIAQALGPVWQTVASNENWTGSKVSGNNLSSLKGSYRLGGGALGAGLHGAKIKATGDEILIKAKIEFTQTDLILYLQETLTSNIDSKYCSNSHDFTADSATDCTTCWFKQTYKLSDLGFTYGETELNMFFGYYNVYGNTSNQSYVDLPISLKLYNYKNGEIKNFGVKNETVELKANATYNVADNMNVEYFDGVATPTATVSYASSNEEIAKVVDGVIVPTEGTIGGEVTITATASSGETATFKVNVDANTVTVNGNVVAGGDSYTILEDLYQGQEVLIGYKVGDALYAVGDTITLTDDVVLEEVTVDFAMLYGASIRLDDTASIRFTAIIDKADLANLEGFDVTYGKTLTAAGKTYDINSKAENFKTGTYEEDYTLYSAVMMGIPSTDYSTELEANAYIK
ncbi:MAG: hypothetical protein IKZ28_06120, partial [Clostridia bacterium]|nr:hypothetical protein [Clostridia bacterium]